MAGDTGPTFFEAGEGGDSDDYGLYPVEMAGGRPPRVSGRVVVRNVLRHRSLMNASVTAAHHEGRLSGSGPSAGARSHSHLKTHAHLSFGLPKKSHQRGRQKPCSRRAQRRDTVAHGHNRGTSQGCYRTLLALTVGGDRVGSHRR